MFKVIKNAMGVTGVEYGLIAGLISIAIIGSVSMTGNGLNNVFCSVSKGFTDGYTDYCAKERSSQIQALLSTLNTNISTLQTEESNWLGISLPANIGEDDADWDQEKSDTVNQWYNDITSEQEQIAIMTSILNTTLADLEKNQGYLDGVNDGTYQLSTGTGDSRIILGVGRTIAQAKSSINRDNTSIKSDRSTIAFYNSMIAYDNQNISQYNNYESQLQDLYSQQATLEDEQNSLSQQ